MDKFLDSLYTKLVLRDVLGKMVPGSMLLGAAYISFLSEASTLREAVQAISTIPVKDWIPILAVGWLTALALQGLGGRIPKYRWLPYIRYCSEPSKPDNNPDVHQFYRDIVHFEKFATKESQRQLFERFTVLHEASGNSQLALVLMTLILLSRFHPWPSSLLCLTILVPVYGLARMHRACVDLKMTVFKEVMSQHPNGKLRGL